MTTQTERVRRIAEVRNLYRSGRARELRVGAAVSQSEFARVVGVSRSTVSFWESGARVPRGGAAERVFALFAALGDVHKGSI